MKTIKRYKNRRLYDTDLKRYITHAGLMETIRDKIPFTVVDSRTGKDITISVLGQVLVGEIKNWQDIKDSREVLLHVINRGGQKSMTILRNTYLASVGIYNVTKKKAEEIIDSLIKAGEISKTDRKDAVMELLDRAEKSTSSFKDKVLKETGSIQKEVTKVIEKIKPANKKDIEELHKKIDKLTRALEKLSKE
ncbi:MAG: phasin family protein [candidate division Zixibacteria bacterium]|nr:phasin family protein [candidate division Zixibacteria bacterium]